MGVDVGGTKVAGALVRARLPQPDAAGTAQAPEVLARVTAATDSITPEACLAGIAAVIERLQSEADGAEGIGLGTASTVNVSQGRIVDSVNLPLADVPIRDILQERFALPVAVDNDATAAAIGEWAFGAGVGTREMLMLTLGTGVGGGIICRGRPYRGFSGSAAELGHIIVDVNGPPCPAQLPQPRLPGGLRVGHGHGRGRHRRGAAEAALGARQGSGRG